MAIAALGAAVLPRATRAQEAPAEQVVVIDTGQRVWRVPYGYLSIRPPAEALQPVNHWRQFSFAFWMPDGRPTRTAGHDLGWLRPGEPGRAPPGPDEFVAIGTNVRAWDEPGAPPRPGQMFANSLAVFGTGRHDYRERWGLLEATPKPGEPGLQDGYLAARRYGEPPHDMSAYVSCPRPGRLDNNVCAGFVSLSGLEVLFHFRLPKDRMDRFLDAADAARRLLASWATDDISNK
ncbi:hypothetical protein GCM10009416_44830 [Craurococcus roseus]|uniref:Secreted protein n=1 Tax=Craurococcus roseus TaxID=77585 RepID=A0ABN1G124_9PROT